MKKFIAAFDGLRFSESAMQYAISLSKLCNAHLVGVFLEDFTRRSFPITTITSYAGPDLDDYLQELYEGDRKERKLHIEQFEEACGREGITFSLHRDKNLAVHELLHESVYADLLIICMEETMTYVEERTPTRFLRELLPDLQCPVLVVPKVFKPIDSFIILYDGTPSSVYAAKNFSYIFDEMKYLEIEFLTVRDEESSMHVPDNKLIKELAKRHFPKATFTVIKGNAEDEIIKHVQKQKKETMLILGAYQRGRVSRLFRPSMADALMQYMSRPLFIAHHKP